MRAVVFRESEMFPQDTLLELVAACNTRAKEGKQIPVIDDQFGNDGYVTRAWLQDGEVWIEWD